MSKKTKDRVTQVKLTRLTLDEYTGAAIYAYDIAWVDSKFAKLNKRVRLEGAKEIWTIAEVYNSKDVEDIEKQFKVWREFATKLGG